MGVSLLHDVGQLAGHTLNALPGYSTLGSNITNPNVNYQGKLNPPTPSNNYYTPSSTAPVHDSSTDSTNNSGGSVYNGGQVLGASTSNGASLYAPQIGSIDAQTAALQGTLGTADNSLTSGLQNIQDQYNQQQSAANLNHSRSLQDFQTSEQNDNLGHQNAIDQVGTKARTLANSVRQMIGNASGSGSSAYQIAAPGAVQRQADLQTQGINDNFGQNMTALTTAKTREGQDYGTLLGTLADTLTKNQNGLKTSIANQKSQINGSLADLAAQRAAYLGGGTGGAQAAAAPYEANIASQTQAINDIANSYKSPFASVTPVSVAAPTLRDYVTGQTNVATDPTGTATTDTATYNPLASWMKQDQSQNQYAF